MPKKTHPKMVGWGISPGHLEDMARSARLMNEIREASKIPTPSLPIDLMALAIEAFGSEAAVLEWLHRPALGLEQRRPFDVLQTPEGEGRVRRYLNQIKHGVYV